MAKLVMTRGLPASGKTTWAKEFVSTTANWKRVNKDDLRSMVDNGTWSKANEKFILTIRDKVVCAALSAGHNIIVDDTNLEPKHERRLRDLAAEFRADFEVKTFDVPMQECINRDERRPNPVGAAIIREMYHRHFAYGDQNKNRRVQDDTLPKAFISDLDGTLAVVNGRNPYDGAKCETDLPNTPVIAVYKAMQAQGFKAVILSGRCELEDMSGRNATLSWLEKHGITADYFEMRGAKDHRSDEVVKGEMLSRVLAQYNVQFVMDDRNRVVKYWRSQGIPCFQVNDGDF